MSAGDVVLWYNYFVLVYFLAINGIYLTLYILSFAEVTYAVRRDLFSGLSELFTSNYAPPISVIVPAYNESATIAASVRSLLALRYPAHEVVVTNDGSKDDTLEVLVEEFGLRESDQPIHRQIETAEIRGVYVSPTERLVVVDKENGGRSDALNSGICLASYPLVCLTDADVIMEEDALLRIARPMIESSEVVAVGGVIRVANGCEIDSGRVVEAKTPRGALPNFQIVEYLRAFLAGRTGWSTLNCLLIISGAFGLFRRRDVIEAGGLATDSIGEDMELTMRLHRKLREQKARYRIVFVPDPIAWTEVPATARVLGRQRDRWHRGLTDSLLRNRDMMFNPRYGTVGLLAMPYFLIFEWLGPIVELIGYAALVAGLALGVINLPFALLFFVVAVGLGALLSVAAVFLEELRLGRYPRWRDLFKLALYGIVENFGYRQLNTYWRVKGLISFARKNTEWGDMEREGFAPNESGEIDPSSYGPVLAALALLLGVAACGVPEDVSARITAFDHMAASVRAGDAATALARVENTGTGERTLWVGYSIRDPSGGWHDAPPVSVELGPGEESAEQQLTVYLPELSGSYGSRVSIWSDRPGADGARRLASRETPSAFRVYNEREDFDALDPTRWRTPSRTLGRGRLLPENVAVEDGRLRITLPANVLDGGELESMDLHGPGFYAASIKVPDAPSSITGFFLYQPPDFESEIDVEIFNDASGKVLFTTYADGEQTHTEEAKLPFDPTQEFHDYAFFYDERSITFYVDGEPMQKYEGGLPNRPMQLYVNSWYPTWLDGKEPDTDRHVYVDWIEH